MEIIFSRHSKRRMSLYNIEEKIVLNHFHNSNIHDKSGKFENVINVDNYKYPIKIVFSVENNYIVIITVYPVKRGLK